jgi:protein ImuB
LRTIVVWCPDWPIVAAEIVDGYPAQEAVAVMHANRVLVASPAAREEGVRRGLRKREAQGRCPHLIVLEHDPGRDMRAFEPVLAAVEGIAAGVETLRAGACALAARGPARYYGGEAAAAERIVEQIAQECAVEAQAGIAEGTFAAGLAARAGVIVPDGETAEFLAGLSIAAIGRPNLVDLLRRLGIHTLGEFAALPGADVLDRFGFDAALAHRLAGGRDERPLAPRRTPADLDVSETFDEPIERVDAAAFAARGLAERLHDRLGAHGLACTRLAIEAVTETGEELVRTWRHDGLLSVNAIADRLRWQLEGWTRGRGDRKIARLRLVPEGVLEHLGLQPGLWGEAGEERDRAHRALSRVQGLLGPDAVLTAVLDGGRADQSRIRLVAWGDERAAQGAQAPWPGRIPGPSPATVYPEPIPAEVLDEDHRPVQVSGRLELSGRPASVRVGDETEFVEVKGWAGPWPVDERWWAEGEARRAARFQLLLADARAFSAVLQNGAWHMEALYD